MLNIKPYVLTVMSKNLDKSWDKVSYRYSSAEDMIWYADYYASVLEQRVNAGEILDYEISY